MESAEKTLSEMVSATDFDTTRFFVEEDKSAQRDPEAIVQEMKAKRQEIEDFYTKVCCCFSRQNILFFSIWDIQWLRVHHLVLIWPPT